MKIYSDNNEAEISKTLRMFQKIKKKKNSVQIKRDQLQGGGLFLFKVNSTRNFGKSPMNYLHYDYLHCTTICI